ncbi:MAG: hypothetical protein IKR07_00065 [Oscillospiraceae bacterium]|nr:hypothetical protein [Oscillospiraceae bacterium]
MKYERRPYHDPSVKTLVKPGWGGRPGTELPIPEFPISSKENFRRLAEHKDPLWITNTGVEASLGMLFMVTGMPDANFASRERHDFVDAFGATWTYVPEAGGPMLKPGTQFMDDITEWERKVKFPNLNDYPIQEKCEWWLKAMYSPEKICHVNIGLGCTERLVALMGGYQDAMIAMATEPEAVRDFLEAFVDYKSSLVDKLCEYLPIDFITYHDDWGTERDTFFSESMMESMVFEPTKRLFGHIHDKGIVIQQHSCGRIGRFIPYMIEAGVDFIQIQERANDVPAYKEKWGDKIGFEVPIRPAATDRESVLRSVREAVDTYAKSGGVFCTITTPDPEVLWDATEELYCYSREKYDEEQGR